MNASTSMSGSLDSDQRRFRFARILAGIAFLIGLAATGDTFLAFGKEPGQIFLATGLWAVVLVLLPWVFDPRPSLFSIWSFAALTIGIGISLRGASLTLGFPDADRLDQLYFLGQPPSFFFGAAAWLLVGLGALVLGYTLVRSPSRPDTLLARFPLPETGRLLAICLGILALSALATVLYLQRTGGFDSGLWSAKRTVIPDLELAGSGYQSHGGLRFLASLALYGHLLALAAALTPGRRFADSWRPVFLGLAMILLGVACVVPFYASLRTPVAMSLLMPVALVFLSGHRLRFPLLGAGIAAALIAVAVMTSLRPSNPHRDGEATPGIVRAFEAAVINRNQVELPKTAHILAALESEELPRAHGKTIARWLLAPIPRSLWSDKPVIPPGPEIGRTVYGQRVAGVPPSLVAELAWNFGRVGMIVGAFFVGMGLRWIDHCFRPVRPSANGNEEKQVRYLFAAALYVAGPMTIAFEVVGGSIGSGIFRAILQTAVMAGLLWLGSRTRTLPTDSQEGR